MYEQIGIVKKVFIPFLENETIMDSKKIGFLVQLPKQELTIIESQNEENATILREDKVVIKKFKDGKFAITKYLGE